MMTQVLSIKNVEAFLNSGKDKLEQLEVIVLLGDIPKEFVFTVKKTKMLQGKRTLITFVEDTNFSDTFRFNDYLAIEITNLVKKVYHGEMIDFPVTVGDFCTSKVEVLTD